MTPFAAYAIGVLVGVIIGLGAVPFARLTYTEVASQLSAKRAAERCLDECALRSETGIELEPIDLTDDHEEPKPVGRKR